jgi:hypothetical protein
MNGEGRREPTGFHHDLDRSPVHCLFETWERLAIVFLKANPMMSI